ncbi:MAG: hypothetical protein PHW96_03990 [Candidatus Nanoarchaeia archaeon]|nr:hypothetical protein [Candidatus Nanoarchaeia archaeon]
MPLLEDILSYEELNFPNYINNRRAVFLTGEKDGKAVEIDLSISDVIKAGVLGGINMLFLSETSGGKTQLMRDICNNYFEGTVEDNGKCLWITSRLDTDTNEIFTELDREKLKRVSNEKNMKALVFVADELNRTHPARQNDFFDTANGEKEISGFPMKLGENGYCLFMAAVNLDRINGDYSGTFSMDKALLSRMHIAIDFDYFEPTDYDQIEINKSNNPRIKSGDKKDISTKILTSFEQINDIASKPNLYIDAVLNLLSLGLTNCAYSDKKRKTKSWPMNCGECNKVDEKSRLCSFVKKPEPRSISTARQLTYSLNKLVEIKYGDVNMDPFDVVFEAFRFTAYHGNMNMKELNNSYEGMDQAMMDGFIDTLKTNFLGIKKYLINAIDRTIKGEIPKTLKWIEYKMENKNHFTSYSDTTAKMLKSRGVKYDVVEPFDAFEKATGIRMDWFSNHLNSIRGQPCTT